ncbi:hypothetical protein [Streptomyces sp. V4I2]|uniref:hypothetical protein n=1 Tax=Streptomyces sp. V4I2 TaxID=3042280 RepID=UPI002783C959|nr:hypothetical protein [Streptomyces sp. V4I2]MDQ1042585.1 hypothetical protein [Streptomyces sp. V4I2]
MAQPAVAVPYPFGSASVPVMAGHESLEALAVVWAAESGGQGLSKAKRRHLRTTAGRLGAAPGLLRAYGADRDAGRTSTTGRTARTTSPLLLTQYAHDPPGSMTVARRPSVTCR